jgi:hypothetical protein
VKIYVAAVDALRKKRKEAGQNRMKLSLLQNMVHFSVSTPPLPSPFKALLQVYFLNLTRF